MNCLLDALLSQSNLLNYTSNLIIAFMACIIGVYIFLLFTVLSLQIRIIFTEVFIVCCTYFWEGEIQSIY